MAGLGKITASIKNFAFFGIENMKFANNCGLTT